MLMPSGIMVSFFYAECHYAECRYADKLESKQKDKMQAEVGGWEVGLKGHRRNSSKLNN